MSQIVTWNHRKTVQVEPACEALVLSTLFLSKYILFLTHKKCVEKEKENVTECTLLLNNSLEHTLIISCNRKQSVYIYFCLQVQKQFYILQNSTSQRLELATKDPFRKEFVHLKLRKRVISNSINTYYTLQKLLI